jgi:hypothetical protein
MKRDNGFHGFIPDAPPAVQKMHMRKAGAGWFIDRCQPAIQHGMQKYNLFPSNGAKNGR